jgi:hypothetical protein
MATIDAMIAEDFAGRILPFNSAAAQAFVLVFLERRAAGRPISFADAKLPPPPAPKVPPSPRAIPPILLVAA